MKLDDAPGKYENDDRPHIRSPRGMPADIGEVFGMTSSSDSEIITLPESDFVQKVKAVERATDELSSAEFRLKQAQGARDEAQKVLDDAKKDALRSVPMWVNARS